LDNPNRFSICYGPSAFLMNALFLRMISNPILASKLCGVILAVMGLLALFIFLRTSFSLPISFFTISYGVLIYLLFYHFSFWNRADSVILFGCSLACCGVLMERKLFSFLTFSLGAALAVNAKFHAILYLLPLLFLYVQRRGKKMAALASAFSLTLSLLPFCALSSFPLRHYLTWLSVTARQDMEMGLFIRNIQYSLLLLWPLLIAFRCSIQGKINLLKGGESFNLALLLICFGLVMIVGAKEGAGPHHLLPFTPGNALFLALIIKRKGGSKLLDTVFQSKNIFPLCATWILTIIAMMLLIQASVVKFLLTDSGKAVYEDIGAIKGKYSHFTISMGYGGNAGFTYTFFRPLLIDQNCDYFLDATSIMDMVESGLEIPMGTIQKIQAQTYDIFLIPEIDGEEPFSMRTMYSPRQKKIFGEILPAAFKKSYTKVDKSTFFSVWLANRHIGGESPKRTYGAHPE